MNGQASNEQRLNPFPWYRTMRESAPVCFDPRGQIWGIFRYDDVQRVLSSYAQFSSEFRAGGQDPSSLFAASMISSDPPRHRQLRTLVTQAFTPRAVDALAPRITQIVHDLLDRVGPAGRMDVVDDLSYPLPVIVIAELLGIPAEDRERFKRWSDATVAMAGTAGMAVPEHPSVAQREMGAYFVAMIERRRREPGDDLISSLLAAQIDGQHLTLPELLGFCTLLLVAGNETTTNLIANAILCFTEQPAASDARSTS